MERTDARPCFQINEEPELPRGICRLCSEETIAATQFRQLVTASARRWRETADHLDTLQPPDDLSKVYYVFMSDEAPTIFKDPVGDVTTTGQAYKRLTSEIDQPKPRAYEKKVKIYSDCPDCGKKFKMAYDLNNHLKKTKNRVCLHCGEVMPKEDLNSHLSKVHKKVLYECSKCYKLFDKEVALDSHIRELHNALAHNCNLCGQGFTSERALRAHMYCHTLFQCTNCKKTFENRKCYRFHKLSCKDDANEPKQFKCGDCGNTYAIKPSLRIHIIQKHMNVLPCVCTVCGKRTSTLTHLKSHMVTHMKPEQRSTYKCDICDSVFTTPLGLTLHQRTHTGEKPYACEYCGERFISASRRLDHVKRRHRSVKDMAHGCPECPSRFVRPFELRKHIAIMHRGEKEKVVKKRLSVRRFPRDVPMSDIIEESVCPQGVCVSCVASTMSAWELRTLVRKSLLLWDEAITAIDIGMPEYIPSTVKSLLGQISGDPLTFQLIKEHIEDPVATINKLNMRRLKSKPKRKPRVARNGPDCSCPDCGKDFISPFYLGIHLKNNAHKDVCLTCGEVVARGLEMVEHMYKKHAKTVYMCSDCPSVFSTESEVKVHKKKHHKPGSLCCLECGQHFIRRSTYEIHLQMHTVRECRNCMKQFANRSCYRVHRAICEPEAKPLTKSMPRSKRSNIRDPATFICDYCQKIYTSRPQLKNHIMWIHMDVRKFECQWCQKKFYTSARLSEHTIVHTRERKFECDICSAKLVTKMALTYHKRRHTGEKPYSCEDCGECFISSSRRSEHAKRRHGKGAFFKCNMCTSGFARGHELVKHLQRVHKIKDPPAPERLKPIKYERLPLIQI